MNCLLSTSCHARNLAAEAVRWCHQITPYRVEISAPHEYQSLEELESALRELRAEGFFLTLHNYFPPPVDSFVLNLAAEDDHGKQMSQALIEGALRLAQAAEAPIYGVHAGYLSRADAQENGSFKFSDDMSSYSAALDRAIAFVNEIAPKFEAQGVHFLIENLFPSPKKRHSLFCSFEEVEEFMNQVPKSVGLLFDLGHMNVSSTILEFERDFFLDRYLDVYSGRLREVHISENGGQKDEHLAVAKGSWQLDALRRIQETKADGDGLRVFCVEARNASIEELRTSVALVDDIIA
jgi:sugar phosphate isomerase/epimerase